MSAIWLSTWPSGCDRRMRSGHESDFASARTVASQVPRIYGIDWKLKMSEAPKIPRLIREQLQVAATKAAEHPETNLLSAFAENVLAAGERSQVLRHLATCADCRDVVAMTVASRGIESPVAAEVRSPRWRVLRWAALGASAAAMLAVIAAYQPK